MLIDAGSFHRDFFMVGRALRPGSVPLTARIDRAVPGWLRGGLGCSLPSLSARGDGGGAAEQYVPEQKDGAMGGSVTADAAGKPSGPGGDFFGLVGVGYLVAAGEIKLGSAT